jgi:hypothetical protein
MHISKTHIYVWLEQFCSNKWQKSPGQETDLGNRGCLKVLNDTKLIINDLEGNSCSFRYDSEPSDIPYSPKPLSCPGLFLLFLTVTLLYFLPKDSCWMLIESTKQCNYVNGLGCNFDFLILPKVKSTFNVIDFKKSNRVSRQRIFVKERGCYHTIRSFCTEEIHTVEPRMKGNCIRYTWEVCIWFRYDTLSP